MHVLIKDMKVLEKEQRDNVEKNIEKNDSIIYEDDEDVDDKNEADESFDWDDDDWDTEEISDDEDEDEGKSFGM